MIKVIDDAIPQEYQDAIEGVLLGGGTNFGWFLNSNTVAYDDRHFKDDPFVEDIEQFTHTFIADGRQYSDYLTVLNPIFKVIDEGGFDVTEILRVKANLNTQSSEVSKHLHRAIHVDFNGGNFVTCLYYVNDADGDTIFFDTTCREPNGSFKETERVTPKKGRLVIFDGDTFHAAQTRVESRFRCVVNFNFLKKEAK